MEARKYPNGVGFVVIVTFFLGFVVWELWALDGKWLQGLPIMFGIWVLYPAVGAVAIKLCEGWRMWAYRSTERWSDRKKIWSIGVWPFVMLYCLISYTIVGIIHRVL